MILSLKKHKTPVRLAVAVLSLLVFTHAHASGGGGLPWDNAITVLQESLTGKVATGVSVIALLGCGAALAFGEELGGIAKRILYVVLAIAIIVLGNKFLAAMGLTGAMLPF